jgi:transposase
VHSRTALINQLRGLLAEFGLIMPKGRYQVRAQIGAALNDRRVPTLAREVLSELNERIKTLELDILSYERRIEAFARASEPMRRLTQLRGVGPISASALVASVGDAKPFRNGRAFAAWLGLVPRQYSTGGKPRLGHITKQGDVYLRTLLIHGARSALSIMATRTDRLSRWAQGLIARRGYKRACVALAAKNARIIWALLAKAEPYRTDVLTATA